MRRLGTVVRTHAGLAVVRAPSDGLADPESAIGTDVVDEEITTVGRVVDVFGPVGRPFLAVSVGESVSPASLLGSPVYAR